MRATENFLRLIWPDAGEKAIVSIKNGQIKHYWFHHNQLVEASDKAHELSQAGLDVYMGVGGFDIHTRKAANAVAFKTLFLDLDCGEGKQYPDQPTARTALDSFVSSLQLPVPLVVSSGYGLHVYWPLDVEVSREEWLVLATALKNLCLQHSFKADDGCTADAARILRPLGTFNYKNGTPRRVEALAGASICITKDLKHALLTHATNVFENLQRQQAAIFDPDKFADFTNFVLPTTIGEGGRNETLFKYGCSLRAKGADDAELYAQLSKVNYELCHPGLDESEVRVIASSCFKFTPGLKPAPPSRTVLGRQYYSDPWVKVNGNGMVILQQAPPNKDGSMPPPDWNKLADYGLQPILSLRLPDGSGIATNHIWMETHDAAYTPHGNFIIPSVNINTTPLFAADCARNGLINEVETSPASFKTFTKIMRNWVRRLEQQQGSVITFRSFGWVGPDDSQERKQFFLGTQLYTPDKILPTPKLPQLENYQNDMRTRGTLEAWTTAMNGYNLPGMEPYMFASWTAWAAPLMGFTNSGNLVFSLVGDTGVGKSSVQKSIISTYGDYDSKILLDRPDSTINSVNGGMGYLNSLPYCRDEAGESDPAEIASWVLTMTEGRERGRMTQQLAIAHVKTWSTIAIISSNTSVREIVVSQRPDNAARLARIWEQEMTTPISQSVATTIFSPLRTNYGHAGPLYVEYLVKNYDSVKIRLIDAEEKFMRNLQATGQDRFYISLLAACYIGAEIAIELGLIHHDLQRGMQYGIKQYKRLRKNAIDEKQSAEQILARLIQDQQPNTIVVEYDQPTNAATVFDSNNNVIRVPTSNNVINCRYAARDGHFYITLSEIRRWYAENRLNFSLNMTELSGHKMVKSLDERVVLTKGTKLADGKQIRCCCFDISKSVELMEATKP